MNGAKMVGGLVQAVKLRVFNDTNPEITPQIISAPLACIEIVSPAAVKAKIENLKKVVSETIDTNYRNRLRDLAEDENAARAEDKAFCLDHTDASPAIQQLYIETGKIPKMIGDAVDPLYDEAVRICNHYQNLWNQDAWTYAYQLRRSMGDGAQIQEYHSSGGAN